MADASIVYSTYRAGANVHVVGCRRDLSTSVYQQLTLENPDKDRDYLSLALAYLRAGKTQLARQTLEQGLARIPDSGELLWGMGVIYAFEGRLQQAEDNLKRSVELLPEWPASYSALGVLYYETG